jgi:hypothetical protein
MSNPLLGESELQDKVSSGELAKQAMALEPESGSFAEAITLAQRKLESLASGMGLSIQAFLEQAEASPRHDEAYFHGLALQRQIKFFKSQLK